MWDEVVATEKQWRDEGSEGDPQLPLLYDTQGRPTMSATEFVGMDAMRMEIVHRVKSARDIDPLSLPEGWYRRDLDIAKPKYMKTRDWDRRE